jgi:hypothetical protein
MLPAWLAVCPAAPPSRGSMRMTEDGSMLAVMHGGEAPVVAVQSCCESTFPDAYVRRRGWSRLRRTGSTRSGNGRLIGEEERTKKVGDATSWP